MSITLDGTNGVTATSPATVKANAILDASGGNTATFNGIPLRQGVLDPDNRIINGAFDFWQRGTSFTGYGYSADRWINSSSGGSTAISQQAFALGDTLGSNNPKYFLRQTVSGQTGSDVANILQRIEDARTYAGQTITVLGWARRSSGAGNMKLFLYRDYGTGGTPSANENPGNVDPEITLSTSWQPFAATIIVSSVAGKTLGTNGNSSLYVGFSTSGGVLGSLQTIGVDLWGIHIKVGTHTTAATDLYKQPEMGPELARCQRYYWTGLPSPSFNYPSFSASSIMSWPVMFPVNMRSTPTLSSNFTGITLSNTSAPSWNGATPSGGLLVTVSTAISTNVFLTFAAANFLAADAEL